MGRPPSLVQAAGYAPELIEPMGGTPFAVRDPADHRWNIFQLRA